MLLLKDKTTKFKIEVKNKFNKKASALKHWPSTVKNLLIYYCEVEVDVVDVVTGVDVGIINCLHSALILLNS